jgi:hypothetical protein
MATDVPTTNDLKNSVTDGAVPGTALALGETVGRGVLGPGLGTALGGVAAASTQSGDDRTTMSVIAFERGMSELFAGAGSGGGNRQGVK